MKDINSNERKALEAIFNDCDEMDGWGFTRMASMMIAVVEVFGNGQVAGGYISDLMKKGLIDVEPIEDEVWVRPEAFETFCAYC